MATHNPQRLSVEALQQALKIPKTFYPLPIREAVETIPCFRDRTTKEECSWALAATLLNTTGEEPYVGALLAAYVTACHNPKGSGLTEALFRGLGEAPRLPSPSLFAPLDDTVEQIVIGFARTLLRLRDRYELVLPRQTPKPREVEHARLILMDHVKNLLQDDACRAAVYVDHLQRQLAEVLGKPLRRGVSRRPPRY